MRGKKGGSNVQWISDPVPYFVGQSFNNPAYSILRTVIHIGNNGTLFQIDRPRPYIRYRLHYVCILRGTHYASSVCRRLEQTRAWIERTSNVEEEIEKEMHRARCISLISHRFRKCPPTTKQQDLFALIRVRAEPYFVGLPTRVQVDVNKS